MPKRDYDFSGLSTVDTTMLTDMERSEAIAQLNDSFRQTFSGGRVVYTQGVKALSEIDRVKVFDAVRAFSAFKKGDDPHGERDFGWFEFGTERIYWKIDYYEDDQMEAGAENPLDPKTYRVLTIMLAEEY
ncbi:MAG: DUF3768 domain-containing protein [Pseudomonadota bacterium]